MPDQQPSPETEGPAVTVGMAEFETLEPEGESSVEGDHMAIIMELELEISIELGRTRMKVKDVLGLGVGAIVELDKIIGEPMDIYANGKVIARGEVVVVDENFGIRVTEIVKGQLNNYRPGHQSLMSVPLIRNRSEA